MDTICLLLYVFVANTKFHIYLKNKKDNIPNPRGFVAMKECKETKQQHHSTTRIMTGSPFQRPRLMVL
jgi:hypothetical protein